MKNSLLQEDFFTFRNGKTAYCHRLDRIHAKSTMHAFFDSYYPILQDKTMWAMDIGTSVGDSTVTMAACLGPGSKIICFEPSQEIQILFEHNIKFNNTCDYDIFRVAASDREEEMDFVYGTDNGGLLPPEPIACRGTCIPSYKVKCVNTYDFLLKYYSISDLDKIQFIKIDTEGWDYVVLRGLAPLIHRNRMPIIAEWWNDINNSNYMFEVIESLSYRAFNSNGEIVTRDDFNTPKRTQDLLLRPI